MKAGHTIFNWQVVKAFFTAVRLGGIGKTTLVTKLAEQIQDRFEFVIWQSLRNAPSLTNLLDDLLKFLSLQQAMNWWKSL